ncbi:MAG: hypothetical protein COW87_01310 [Candidatus Levybacteria bacterium CG22_combo_CG10-13_8_21_14_all_35_11]|nr:MAG: hypothetical protein COW87_01310 [Candidatus Levybacteria bacterium CG22_combo_CG10-13_8_21_14_all_35_11]
MKLDFMPKRTLALIIFLIVATVGLVALSVYNKPPEPAPIVKKPVIPEYVQTIISLSNNITPVATKPGQFQTEAIISTGSNKVTAVQLELTYDPKALSNVTITPGTFIKEPTVLLKKVDPVLGRITLAMGVNMGESGVNGDGQIAIITFTPNVGYTTTQIGFMPTTGVSAEGVLKSVLKRATGAVITLEQPAATTSASPRISVPTNRGE